MNVKLFQIIPLQDNENVMFRGYNLTQKHGGVNPAIYEKVFDGELPIKRLEDVFQIFNTKLPEDYSGRSMSVSDVVCVEGLGTFFCDNIGFVQLKGVGFSG